jgi:4'-phosphopantetheinyl transferase
MLSLTVHLWSLVLPPPEWVRVALLALLSADERARMGAFLVDEPRYTFGVTRGLLRRVLSWHCPEVAPMGWMFTPDANGKPYARPVAVGFNVSHTAGRALVAVLDPAPPPEAGVWLGADVERVRVIDWRGIAGRFFDASEQTWIAHPQATTKPHQRFFDLWTLKEAALKAGGWGLSGVERITCAPPVDPVSDDTTLRLSDDLCDNRRVWRVRYLPLGPEHPAAVAVSAFVPFSLRCVHHDAHDALAPLIPSLPPTF